MWVCEHNFMIIFLKAVHISVKSWSLCRNPLSVSLPSPPIVLVATAATPVLMVSASASAAVVTVAAPVVLVVIAVPAVLLVAAGALLLRVALISAAAVHLGRLLSIRGVIMLPRAPSARISTCGRLPLLRRGEAAIQLLKLLHLELPHHVVHLQMT